LVVAAVLLATCVVAMVLARSLSAVLRYLFSKRL
jgi:hypothetical protein